MQPTTTPATPVSTSLRTAVLLLTVLALLMLGIDSLWATSSDTAHHYALVARIAQQWGMPAATDPSLGEMNIYPHNSHMMAAALGVPLQSPMLGMQLVTLLSMIGAWAGMGALLLSLPRRAGLTGAAVLGLLLLLNGHHLDIFGKEDIGNFFYAQLVAQALMVGALVLALQLDRRAAPAPLRHWLLIGAIYLLAGTHLLPASQLVCVVLALVVLDFPWRRAASVAGRARDVAGALLTMAAAVLVLLRHPAYAAMKQISQNDGALSLALWKNLPSIAVFCVVIALLSATLALTWLRMEKAGTGAGAPFLALKYVGLFGLAASGLCLLQIVLLHWGQGSFYAVKKHAFALNSIFLLELALLPALRAARRPLRPDVPSQGWHIVHAYLALPLLTALAFCAQTTGVAHADTAAIVALEHRLELRRDLTLRGEPGKYVYVMDVPGMPTMVSYLMTIGVFGTPRTENSLSVLAGQPLAEPDLVGTIYTGAGSNLAQLRGCTRPGTNSGLAEVDGQCAMRELGKGRPRIGMTSFDSQPNCILTGLSGAEPGGRWTEQRQARLQCPVPILDGVPARSLTISATPFLNGVPAQRASFTLNGGAPQALRFVAGQPVPAIVLPLPAASDDKLDIVIDLPDAVSPQQLGLSGDPRQLGLMIKSLEFK